jgi:hypothetical protein
LDGTATHNRDELLDELTKSRPKFGLLNFHNRFSVTLASLRWAGQVDVYFAARIIPRTRQVGQVRPVDPEDHQFPWTHVKSQISKYDCAHGSTFLDKKIHLMDLTSTV